VMSATRQAAEAMELSESIPGRKFDLAQLELRYSPLIQITEYPVRRRAKILGLSINELSNFERRKVARDAERIITDTSRRKAIPA